MTDLLIPRDAFSHGQIRSKVWLSENFSKWSKAYLKAGTFYTLNWYGSWVGIGPFVFLLHNQLHNRISFKRIQLYDLSENHLVSSKKVLDYWHCESTEIITHTQDVNLIIPLPQPNQIFINTSCEHIKENTWLKNIPVGALVLLQSTNMQHIEHINCSMDLNNFVSKYSPFIDTYDSDQIDFSYPDKKFSRFMLFGIKK